ncbi:dihydroorotate dehydrogenase [Micromonospora aurantiaca]|uniref:dihydroorotate dehydrogenase n=1 Tax=Micromonospora aurantiaca (nom. illeg.) TaxID=47850 RepID=UPI0033AE1AC3
MTRPQLTDAGPSVRSTADGSDRLGITVGGLHLANPVMPASGCFGPELAAAADLGTLGAVVTKTVFRAARSGNPAHRLAEVPGGMLNSVGIPSVGAERFRREILPAYRELGPPVIVSIGGLSAQDYWDVTEALADEQLDAFEVNVSCPNLEHNGLEMGSSPREVERVTAGVRRLANNRPVIVKLTPNVASIADIAQAAEAGGADALTVANTYVGMSVGVRDRRATLGSTTGGLSGPAVKPLVLRLVWQTVGKVGVPVIACGGASSALDVMEYLIVGAVAVQVGTANFTQPTTMRDIVTALPATLDDLGARSVTDIVGTVVTA